MNLDKHLYFKSVITEYLQKSVDGNINGTMNLINDFHFCDIIISLCSYMYRNSWSNLT